MAIAGVVAVLAGSPPLPAADSLPLVVIVSAKRADQLDPDEIANIYKRRKVFWNDGSRIIPLNLPADHPLRQRFSRSVLNLAPEGLEEFWNEQYFHGVLPPHVLLSENAVLRFVSETGSAIGYIAQCLANARVRPVLIIAPDGHFQKPETSVVCN